MTDRLIGLTHVLVSRADDPAVARDMLRLVVSLTRAMPGRELARLTLSLPPGSDEQRAAEAWAAFRDALEG